MKTIGKKTTLAIITAIMLSTTAFSQPLGPKAGNRGPAANQSGDQFCRMEKVIPDLTDEQAEQLKALRMEQWKETRDFRNQMGELNAKQKTLMSADQIDQKAVDKIIDQKTALMNTHMKKNIEHKAAVNKVLTEDQRMALAQMQHRRGQFRQGAMGPNGCQGTRPQGRQERPARQGRGWNQ